MPRLVKRPGSGAVILVVDDQEEVLQSTQALLAREGHRVLTAASGDAALRLLREQMVDLILVDYVMPRMTGEQFVAAVRAFDLGVPILLQTGYAGEKPPRDTLAALDIQGCHDKADGPAKLLLWIDSLLKVHRQLTRLRDGERAAGQRRGAAERAVILVEPTLRSMATLAPVLAEAGYRLLPAQSGAEALDLVAREGVRLLVVDDSLLDQSGVELIRRVRGLDAAAAVIARSEDLDATQRRRIRQRLGLFAVSDKTEDPQRLVELIDAAAEALRNVERARADQSLRGVILAKLCHDLRSSLHVIHGYAEVLGGEPALPAALGLAQSRLIAASRDACDLTEAYLALAHFESPRIGLHRALVNVDALVADLRAQVGGMNAGRQGPLVVHPFAAGAVLHTDREKLQAVLAHLVCAALKFSTAGPVELQVGFGADHTDFVVAAHAPGALTEADGFSAAAEPEVLESILGTAGQSLAVTIAQRLGQLLGAAVSVRPAETGELRFAVRLPIAALTDSRPVDPPTLH